MNNRVITILAGVIVASVALVLLLTTERQPENETIGSPVLPEMKERLGEAKSVRIATADSSVEIHRVEGRWTVRERDDYPANFEQLSELLDALADGSYAERKTSKPENFERLGLRDISEDGSKAKAVTVSTGDKTFELLVGEDASNRDGQFFRFPGENQSWLLDRGLDVETDTTDWLQTNIVDIDSKRIKEVSQTTSSGGTLRVFRKGGEDDDFEVDGIPSGRELRYATVANELGRSLVNVRLKDVSKNTDFDWTDSGRAEYLCYDGLFVSVLTKAHEDRYYLKFLVADEPVPVPAAEPATAEGGEEGEEAAKEPEVVSAGEIARLKRDLEPWVFEVTQYTFDDFTKTMEDLLKEEKSEEDEGDAGS